MNSSSKASRKRARGHTEHFSPPNQNQAPEAPSSSGSADDKPGVKNARKKLSDPPSRHRPLNGMVIAVSTLASNNSRDSGNESSNKTSYNEMVKLCKDLGAEVTSQICKKVNVLICTKSAVDKSTQRVRKAIKQRKPVVSIEWIEACRSEGKKVDYAPFRIDVAAEEAINKRQRRLDSEGQSGCFDEGGVPDTDAGWTEPVNLGCCCACHELGTTKDCEWCTDCSGR